MKCPQCRVEATPVGAFWICPTHGQLPGAATPAALRIFLSYGHDSNESLVRRIKDDLEHRGHDVWFDKSEIKFGDEWRRAITDGILKSQRVLSFLSKYSTRDPGVCRDEIAIAIGVKGGSIQTILVESEQDVQPPVSIGHVQWLDMHDWQERRAAGEPAWEEWYQAKFAEIVRVVESDESRRFSGEIETLSGYLKPIKSEARIGQLLGKGFLGRRWLFDAVERWRQDAKPDSRLFWIQGAPGVGKSAFAAQLTHTRGDTVLAAQFCEWDKPDHRSAQRVVRSIAFQLATRLPDYRKLLLTLPELDLLDRKDAAELFDYLLANPLRSAIDGGRDRQLIVIDALDEACEGGRNPLVEMLARNARSLPAWIGILVTSRPEFDVQTPLQSLNPVPLDTASEANRADIRDYVRRGLAAPLRSRPDADLLVERILEKSEGVFLYVERVCDDVQRGDLSLDRLEQFPQGLGGIFCQYFQRQFPDLDRFRQSVRPALRAILAAREPLPVETLQRLFSWQKEDLRDFIRPLASLFPVATEGGHEVIKPYHKSLADWLAEEAKAGPHFVSLVEGHRMLADFLLDCWGRIVAPAAGGRRMTEAGPGAYQGDSASTWKYLLACLPAHLAKAERWDQLVTILTSIEFIEAKCVADRAYELANDYAAALRVMRDRGAAGGVPLSELSGFAEFFGAQIHVLAAHPRLTWQQAANQPADSPVSAAVEALRKQGRGGRMWLQRLNKPSSICARPLTLIGHSRRVTTCAFSASGFVVTGSEDGTLRSWSADDGRPLHTFSPPDGRSLLSGDPADLVKLIVAVHHLSAAPPANAHELDLALRKLRPWGISSCAAAADGRGVALGGADGSLRLLDSGMEIVSLVDDAPTNRAPAVTACWVSGDRRSAVFGMGDGQVRFADFVSRKAGTLREAGKQGEVLHCGYQRSGNSIFACFADGSLSAWDLEARAPQFDLRLAPGAIVSACYAPDEGILVALSDEQEAVAWDLKQRVRKYGAKLAMEGTACAISPDARCLVTAGARKVEIRCGRTGRVLAGVARPHGSMGCVACAPDGSRFLIGLVDGSAEIHRTPDRQPAWDRASANGSIGAVRFIAPTKFAALTRWSILTGDVTQRALAQAADLVDGASPMAFAVRPGGASFAYARDDCSVVHVVAGGAEPPRVLSGHEFDVTCLAFHPSGKLLASSSCDSTARLWDLEGGQCAGVFEHTGPLSVCQFSPDGDRLGTFGFEGIARVWDARSGALLREVSVGPRKWTNPFVNERCPEVQMGGRALVPPQESAHRFTTLSTHPFVELAHPHVPFAFSPGLRFCAVADGARLRVCDLLSGETVLEFKDPAAQIVATGFSPDGAAVLACDRAGRARVWDMAAPTWPCRVYESSVAPLRFGAISALGHMAAVAGKAPGLSGGDRAALTVWPFGLADCPLVYPDAPAATCLQWNATGELCVLGESGGDVHVLAVEGVATPEDREPPATHRAPQLLDTWPAQSPWRPAAEAHRWRCPEDPLVALVRRAEARIEAGDYSEAVPVWQDTIARIVDSGGLGSLHHRRILFHLGRTRFRTREFALAVRCHMQALDVIHIEDATDFGGVTPDTETEYAVAAWHVAAALRDSGSLASWSDELAAEQKEILAMPRGPVRSVRAAMMLWRFGIAAIRSGNLVQFEGSPVITLAKSLLREHGCLARRYAGSLLALWSALRMATQGCEDGRREIEGVLREVRGDEYHVFNLTNAICDAGVLLSRWGAHAAAEVVSQYYIRLAGEIANEDALNIGWHNLGVALMHAGRLAEGEALIRRSIEAAGRAGKEAANHNAWANLSECLVLEGRLEEAGDMIERAAAGLAESDFRWLKVLRVRGLVAEAKCGDDAAKAWMRKLLDRIEETDRPIADFQRAARMGLV